MKRALIIKDPTSEIRAKQSHVEVRTAYELQYIGVDQLYAIYINQEIVVEIKTLVTLAQRLPVYFTTAQGKLLFKMSSQV